MSETRPVTRSLRKTASDENEPPHPRHTERHKPTVIGGLAALSLDAMASVAYGVSKRYLGRPASLVAGASSHTAPARSSPPQ